jgi:hypothetical protein
VWRNILSGLTTGGGRKDLASLADSGQSPLKRLGNWRRSLLHLAVVIVLLDQIGLASSITTKCKSLLAVKLDWRRPNLSCITVVEGSLLGGSGIDEFRGLKGPKWDRLCRRKQNKLVHTSQRNDGNTSNQLKFLWTNGLIQQSTTI